eukprot:s1333_g19.t1
MLALEDWKDDERLPLAPVKEALREENPEDDAVAATLAALRSKTSSKVAEPTAEEKESRMKRPRRRRCVDQLQRRGTDPGSGGWWSFLAVYGTEGAQGKFSVHRDDTHVYATGVTRGGVHEAASFEGKFCVHGDDTHVFATGVTRGGVHEAASFEENTNWQVCNGFLAGCAGAQSASASSAPSVDTMLEKHEPRSAMAPKKKHGHEKKMKRPAAKKVVRKPMGTVEEREARRQAVLAIVPEELREQFRAGCTTCRGRAYCTVSCWAKRGFVV